MLIGLKLEEAIEQLGDKKYKIVYNNSDKLDAYDAQLVVDYKNINDEIILIVSNFKLKVNND